MTLETEDSSPSVIDLSHDIQRWIEDVLANQLTSVSLKEGEDAKSNVGKGSEDEKAVDVISRLRAYIDNEVSHMEREITDITKATAALDATSEAWLRAGAGSLISALGEDTLDEVQHFVRACVALQVNPDGAARHIGRVAAMTRVIDDASTADARHAHRNTILSQAHDYLRSAANQLQSARRIVDQTDRNVVNRTDSAARDADRAGVMAVKAKQYGDATATLAERIRSTGLSTNATHDAVAADAKRLTEMEEKLADVNRSLELFHDLPAVCLLHLFPSLCFLEVSIPVND